MNPEEHKSGFEAFASQAPLHDATQPPYPSQQPPAGPPPNPPMPPTDSNPHQRVGSELAVMQPGETVICEIKRHPIGIIGIYAAIVFVLGAAAGITFAVVPSLLNTTGGSSGEVTQLATVIFMILAFVAIIYALIVTKVYWGNRWIVTSDSVTQIEQTSLFSRQSSQLALSNIEDVTAEQHGILTHIFSYGVLKAETAGHHGKFVFTYAPNPNYYAQKILAARENLIASGKVVGHH